MKSLLYIGQSQRRSTEFARAVRDILSKEYDIYEFSHDPHNINYDDYESLEGRFFDVVVCWQIIPPRHILDEKISFKKGIFFTMNNEEPGINSSLLSDYNDFLVISFSQSIYLQCLSTGGRGHYIQNSPESTNSQDTDERNSPFLSNCADNGKINKWIHNFCNEKKNILIDEEFLTDEIFNNKNNLKYIIDHNKFNIYAMCKHENVLYTNSIIQKNNLDIAIVTNKSQLEFIDAYLCSNLNNESLILDKKWISKYSIHDTIDVKSIVEDIETRHIQYPKVTVVTVVYNIMDNNRRESLIRCFNSVHSQIYDGEIEHLVIDGCSTDGTIDLLESFAQKGWIKFLSESDKGIYDAMNKGLSNATGEFIAYINSDDSYKNVFAIKCCIKSLVTEKSDYCFGNILMVSSDGTRTPLFGNIGMLPFASHYCHQSMFIKTNVMREMKGFNLEYKIAADNDIMLQLYALHKKYTYINLCYVRYQQGGWSTQNYNQLPLEQATTFYKRIGKNYGLTFEECLQIRNGQYTNWDLNTFTSVFKRLSDDCISRALALCYFNLTSEDNHVKVTQYFFYKKMAYKILLQLPIKSKKSHYINKYKNIKNDLKHAAITKIHLAGLKIITKISFKNITFFNIFTNIPLLAIKRDRNFSVYILGMKILRTKTRN